MPRLFVYGTLRSPVGGPPEDTQYHGRIADGIESAAPALLDNAVLIDCGSYPALGPGDGVVRGEVFTISDDVLAVADGIEGHPDFYERRVETVAMVDGSTVEAWVYWAPDSLLNVPGGSTIESGDWFERDPITSFPPPFDLGTNEVLREAFTRFEAAECSWFSSVRRDGRPHVVPMWHVLVGNRLYFVTPSNAAKIDNIATTPDVVVTLPDPNNVVIVEGWSIEASHLLEVLAPLVLEKYDWDPRLDQNQSVIEVTPRIVRAWSGEHDHRRWKL